MKVLKFIKRLFFGIGTFAVIIMFGCLLIIPALIGCLYEDHRINKIKKSKSNEQTKH